MTSKEVCEFLDITPNNLHQLQHRGHLRWTAKTGKNVLYFRPNVEDFKSKRDNRKK